MFDLIDIGINLMHARYHHDRDSVIEKAIEVGVSKMIITGTTLWNSKSALTRAEKHPNVLFSTAGVHPHNARDCNNQVISELRLLAKHKTVVAIGECGLDFDRDFSPRDVQEKYFEEQIKLACELKLPLFLHEREAHKRFSEILSSYHKSFKKAVVHCFTGNRNELEKYLEMGLYIGITGAVCDDRRFYLKELIKYIPLDRLMIETDGPFLLPRDLKNKPSNRRNEPLFLPHILKTIAESLDKDPEEVAIATTKNAKEFFSI